jgi:hypothetical protein
MMRTCVVLLLVTTYAHGAAPPLPSSVRREEVHFFEKSIRPLLHKRCFACHSQEKKKRGGLLLDSRSALLEGGDSGSAVVPGQPAKSLLVHVVRHDHATIQMPPEGKLADHEISLLEEWIKRGVVFPGPANIATRSTIDLEAGRRFWSFQPLAINAIPNIRDTSWPRGRLDGFLHAAMERHGLSPSREADRRTLIRRVTFDLIGLPPTPEEVEAFIADSRPDAYERLVDRLLASPAHGERWGRFWLDLVRYCDVAESWTTLKGSPYLYRDWVVQALNDDMGYDRFVEFQLAADLVPTAKPADRAALGFLGLSPIYWKELKLDHQVIKGVVAEEWEERIHTLSSTFLGLTVACARCHDHKFDPISTRDYYALAGIFASIRQEDVKVADGKFVPGIVEGTVQVLPDGPHKTKLINKNEPVDVAMQIRGNPASAGVVVPRGSLNVLSKQERRFQKGSGRLELAQSLVGEAHPLVSRVIVNRVWRHHFGEGIVRTPSDFGTQGERPTHSELLDDLSARFIASGWSMKWLHREIVLSSAYCQMSRRDDARDPENRWLARMMPRKLEVEAWRDAMLHTTGTLTRTIGGAAISLDDANHTRRTLYGQVKRRELADVLRLHDFPDPTTHSAGRIPTTTPLQQLYVLNSSSDSRWNATIAFALRIACSMDASRPRRSDAWPRSSCVTHPGSRTPRRFSRVMSSSMWIKPCCSPVDK